MTGRSSAEQAGPDTGKTEWLKALLRTVPNGLARTLRKIEDGGRWLVPGNAFDRHQGLFWFLVASLLVLGLGAGLPLAYWDQLRGVTESANPETQESVSSTIRNVTIVVGGFLALVLTLWRGWLSERDLDQGRQRESNERQWRGTELLGADVLAVRIGGVRALQDLAEEQPEEYYVRVALQLCAFIRNPTADKNDTEVRLRSDVQAAVQGIGRMRRQSKVASVERAQAPSYQPNLIDANLRDGRFYGLDLSRAVCRAADFSDAGFGGVDFENADLRWVKFDNAVLSGRNIDDPDAMGHPARFVAADLKGASFTGSDLSGVDFTDANITDAIFFDGEGTAATGLTQEQLDKATAEPDKPPKLDGLVDAVTGRPLVWRGEPPI